MLTEFPICDDVLFERANAPTIIITTAIAAIKKFSVHKSNNSHVIFKNLDDNLNIQGYLFYCSGFMKISNFSRSYFYLKSLL